MRQKGWTLITNNDKVLSEHSAASIEFVDGDASEVLLRVRNLIHCGWRLVSHPLAGSLKPGENPYKSVVLESGQGQVDYESLAMIEAALEAYRKFEQRFLGQVDAECAPAIMKMHEDLKTIDLLLLRSVTDI